MEVRPYHWMITLILASAAHLGLALLFYEPKEGAQAVGLGGIEVSLGPAGGTSGAADTAVEPGLTEAKTPEVPETSAVEPELERVAAETAEVVEPLPETVKIAREPVRDIEVAPPEDIVSAESESIIPPLAKVQSPVDEARAQEVKPEPPPPKPKPKPEPLKPAPAKPTPSVSAPAPAERPLPARTAPVAPRGTGGKAGIQTQQEAGSGNATPGGGIPGAVADYYSHLRAWLEKHKRYPRPAQLRRQEGTVLLRFIIDQQGRVLSYRLEESSGYRLLDKEVEEMIQRASPLPAIPDEIQQAQLELVVPVAFFLR